MHVVDVELCNSLRTKGIAPFESDSFRLEFFTVFESGARAWLNEHWVLGRLHARGSGPAHLVVAGVGNMGRSLVVGAVRQWLTLHPTDGERLRITMVDRWAEQKRGSLRLRYPLLDSFCDLVPMEMEIESPEFERGDFLFDGAGGWEVTSVYVCLDDPARCLKAGQMLAQKLDGRPVPVIVRMIEDAGLAAFLRRDDAQAGSAGGLRAFPSRAASSRRGR